MTEIEIAWAAGLFEGEGCIYSSPRGRGRSRKVCVVSTDRDVIDRFHQIVGIGRVGVGSNAVTNPAWKPNYEWRVTQWDEMVHILRLFLPYFCERRRLAAEQFLADPVQYVRTPRVFETRSLSTP